MSPSSSLPGPHLLLPLQGPVCSKLWWPKRKLWQTMPREVRARSIKVVPRRVAPHFSSSKKQSRPVVITSRSDSREAEWRRGKGRRSQATILGTSCPCGSKVLSLICHSLTPLSLKVHLREMGGGDRTSRTVLQKVWGMMSLRVHARDTCDTSVRCCSSVS